MRQEKEQASCQVAEEIYLINEMLLCKDNIVAVREELSQLDDLFKIIEDNEKMIALDEAIQSDDQWFDELDEKTFAIKHKVYSSLKEAERELDDAESRRSTSKNQAIRDQENHQSHHQKEVQSEISLKDQAMNEKLKVAELLQEQKFMEKCKAADYEVETL